MEKREQIYEGKAKSIFATDNADEIIMYFKDDATAFNGVKKDQLEDKGILNNKISTLLYGYLIKHGVKTHWIKTLNEREQLCKKVEIVPLEVIIRNRATGSFVKRYAAEEGKIFKIPTFELSYKNDDLGDPLLNDDHALALELVTEEELAEIKKQTFLINDLLSALFDKMNLILVDYKIEFGRDKDGNILLADEISPDSMRLWDKDTLKKLDKDRFRQDLGDVMGAYREVLRRMEEVLK